MKRCCGTADGVLNAVENVDDSMNFLNGAGNTRSSVGEEFWILREKLNDDGLGLAGEVANHVLQDLDEFHLGGRLGLLDFGTNVGDDLINVPLAVALELNGEITTIGFGNRGKAKLQASAARSVFDFGLRTNNFFDVLEDAVGFRE